MTLTLKNRAQQIYETLEQKPRVGSAIVAEFYIGDGGALLGMDAAGRHYVLLPIATPLNSPGIRLKHLSVDFALEYAANIRGREVRGNYAGIVLSEANPKLLSVFCNLFEVMIETLPALPNNSEVSKFVEEFIALFTPRPGNLRDKVKGLFAELTLIDLKSEEPELWVQAWHEQTTATKDFSFGDCYLEVKCTEGAIRKHSFSLSQLVSDLQRPTYVSSLMIFQDPQGENVFQIANRILGRLHDLEMKKKLSSQVLSTLGDGFDEASELKFLTISGDSSIWIYEALDLPIPNLDSTPQQRAISSVAFDLNFEMLDAMGVKHFELQAFNPK